MDAREPLESTQARSPRRLTEVATRAALAALAATGLFWIAISDLQGVEATAVFFFLAAIAGGVAVALCVRLSNGAFGAADAQPLATHPGWFRFVPGRSGGVGFLALAGVMSTAALRAPWMGPPMLLCLALGALAAPVIFVVQRKRAARSLPLSIAPR
jgi:hypothetical protein